MSPEAPRIEDVDQPFRVLFDSMPQLGWTARADGYIDFYNRRWYEYTGTTFEEMQGWGWKTVHDPSILPSVMERWEAAIREGTPFEMEFPLRRHDGVYRWFLTRVNPVRASDGRIVRWIGVNIDIHDRKLADAASELRTRLLVESIREYAIFMLDAGGHVASWNPGAERIKQYRADEILGKHFSVFYPEEDGRAGKCELELEVAGRTGRFEDEGWRVRKDGSRFWANVVISAVHDENNRLVGFAKVTRDLTDRRRAEEERVKLAREQEARASAELAQARFRFLSEASALLTSSLDYHTTLKSVAQLVVPRYADWCVIELVEGDRLRQVAVVHSDPAKMELARRLAERWPSDPNAKAGSPSVVRTGQSELYEEITDEMLAKSARDPEQLRYARELALRSGLAVPIRASGRVIGALTLIFAESNRRYTPDDVALIEDLGGRAGMAIDNARLFYEARDAVRIRDEFLSIASHELKTPLTSLQLQVSGLQRQLGKPAGVSMEKLGPRMDILSRQVDRLTRLINTLLDVSRASAGKLQLEEESVDLAKVIRESIEPLRSDLSAASCELSLKIEGPIVGRWDALRLDQVFTNLLSNAIKYGAGKPIDVRALARDGRAIVSVVDQGIGISEADQERIFQRFGRAVPAEHYGGLGLGLWIVKELVEAMGGTISLESQPGAGSCFTLTLPLERARSETDAG